MRELILSEIQRSIKVKKDTLVDEKIISQIEALADNCLQSIRQGGKIIFCGNGGSFADSQHLAAEFVSRLRFDRAPISSIALGTNSSNLSAIGNDYGYDEVFRREIMAFFGLEGRPGLLSGLVMNSLAISRNSKILILKRIL